MVSELGTGKVSLDFAAVTSVNFAALRVFLNSFNDGKLFSVFNASEQVYEMFDATGTSKAIDICKMPREFDMPTVRHQGGGFTAESYTSIDGDSMIKIYEDFIPRSDIEREKIVAQNVLSIGVPSPLVGDLIKVGGRSGIEFERMLNKKSFARLTADDPRQHAGLCQTMRRSMQETPRDPCDTKVFPSAIDVYRRMVGRNRFWPKEDREYLLDFLDTVPENDHCLHGDLHIGNVIVADGRCIFIDMAGFSYGDPNFDLGGFYEEMTRLPEELAQRLYHTDAATIKRFWDFFVRAYFETDDANEIARIERRISPFGALRSVFKTQHSNMPTPSEDMLQTMHGLLYPR